MANSTKNKPKTLVSVLVLLIVSLTMYGFNFETSIYQGESSDVSFLSFQDTYDWKRNQLTVDAYLTDLEEKKADSLSVYKKLAFMYAEMNEPELSVRYINKYILASLDTNFVGHGFFDPISDSEQYKAVADKYLKKIDYKSFFCFYVAFIGFFISVVLNFREKSDRISNLLMSVFILIHSVFIIHIGLYFSNYQYYIPHILYMSTLFSFLYGPLMYFYFKRVTKGHTFTRIDLLHIVPTIVLCVILIPIYSLPYDEKLKMLVHGERPYLKLISISKLISLLIYGGFVLHLYFKTVKTNKHLSRIIFRWQRNIVIFCFTYIISYSIYSVLIIKHVFSGFLRYTQVVSMALLVLYVSYTAFVKPSIFGRLKLVKNNERPNPVGNKYKKSGLTENLSLELKEKLEYLLDAEKVYRQNDITLQILSERMETTRHNTSQIINEHFNLNFFELINKYRIDEAKELLKGEKHKNFTIIDVAYEVGFNNKVTFNKSFKKYNHITPSEYMKSLVA